MRYLIDDNDVVWFYNGEKIYVPLEKEKSFPNNGYFANNENEAIELLHYGGYISSLNKKFKDKITKDECIGKTVNIRKAKNKEEFYIYEAYLPNTYIGTITKNPSGEVVLLLNKNLSRLTRLIIDDITRILNQMVGFQTFQIGDINEKLL